EIVSVSASISALFAAVFSSATFEPLEYFFPEPAIFLGMGLPQFRKRKPLQVFLGMRYDRYRVITGKLVLVGDSIDRGVHFRDEGLFVVVTKERLPECLFVLPLLVDEIRPR